MAKVTQKQFSIGINVLFLVPGFIKLVELFHGHAPGAEKKAAVIQLAQGALQAAGAAAVANNPQYKDLIGGVIDGTVGAINSGGQMPTPIAAAP